MKICGIDPGLTGALAFLETDPLTAPHSSRLLSTIDMPVAKTMVGKRLAKSRKTAPQTPNWWAVAAALREEEPDLVVLENQRPMPQQGVVSMFSLGRQMGGLEGVLAALGLPFEVVEPVTWKWAVGLKGREKEASRQLALKLMPEGAALFGRKRDHGRAEAALIALWKASYEKAPIAQRARVNLYHSSVEPKRNARGYKLPRPRSGRSAAGLPRT
jgi:crossover junction endodeoxyribonuclease RuvC